MDRPVVRPEQLSYALVRQLFRRALIPLLLDLEVAGFEHVPRAGGHIVAANHLSYIDIPLMMALCPRRPRILAKQELFSFPPFAAFFRWGDAIPLRRSSADRVALRAAMDTLKEGAPVGIFPEATRSKTGQLLPAYNGAGLLALRGKAPVLPMAIHGTDGFFRGRVPRPGTKVRVTFGAPITPEELAACGGVERTTQLIMSRLAALLPPEARGPYPPDLRCPEPGAR